jgi:hypothetical protein
MKTPIQILILILIGIAGLFFPFYFAQEILPYPWISEFSPQPYWWSFPMAILVLLSWAPFALVIAGLLKKWFNI